MLPRPSAYAVLAATVALAGGLLSTAQAQLGPPPTTSTTTPADDTTTTSTPPSTLLPGPSPTTTAPPPDDGQGRETPPPGQLPEGGGDAPLAPGTPQVVPPEFQALINSVKRTKANNTTKLLAALQPLVDAGMTQEEAIAIGFGRFPMGGQANYFHDWWYPRFTPTFHLHEGTDIFAPAGAPVRSPADGTLRQANGPVGGNAAYVTTPDGTYYYLAHLSGFPPGQVTGQKVKVGDVIGYNGDSGNAAGGSPHVHFEIHPAPTKVVTTGRGKNRVSNVVTVPVRPGTVLPPTDPKPYLDQWLTDAIANVPNLLAELEANKPRVIVATGMTRRIGDGVFAAPTTPSRDQLLWASSASPSGGALQLAQAEAALAAQSLDWDRLSRVAAGEMDEWSRANAASQRAVSLVTPGPLRRFLEWGESQE